MPDVLVEKKDYIGTAGRKLSAEECLSYGIAAFLEKRDPKFQGR